MMGFLLSTQRASGENWGILKGKCGGKGSLILTLMSFFVGEWIVRRILVGIAGIWPSSRARGKLGLKSFGRRCRGLGGR